MAGLRVALGGAHVFLGLVFVSSCSGQETTQLRKTVASYTVLLEEGADESACASLGEPNLAGDCALVAAQGALVSGSKAEQVCSAVPQGVWQSECWFVAAEYERRQGQETLAAEYCLRSGPFVEDCVQHLWQTAVHRLIYRKGAGGFGESLGAAEQLLAKWTSRLGPTVDVKDKFWNKYYQNGFEGDRQVKIRKCAVLPIEHKMRCEKAALALFERELAPRLERAGAWSKFCALAEPDSAAVVAWIGGEPDRLLDAAVVARHQAVCQDER